MFIYLSKKIAIPSDAILNSVAWDSVLGYLVCGGTKSYHKILKFEEQRDKDDNSRGISAAFNITLNQTLTSHTAEITKNRWNLIHPKFASADASGVVVIWVFYNGKWCEEMVNNRQKSPVSDLQWSPDGEKIIIVYVDGSMIMGTVDGRRLWGKEVKDKIKCLQWSPDSRLLLMASETDELQIYDCHGNYMTRLTELLNKEKVLLMEWYCGKNGYVEENCPSLVIACESGLILLLQGEKDTNPIFIHTNLKIQAMKWNNTGSLLAIVGVDQESSLLLSLYECYGQHLRTMKVPGKIINSVTWEPSGIRLALAVDSYIYIANCRPNYLWTYVKGIDVDLSVISDGTLVYSTGSNVNFWNLRTNEVYQKQVTRLLCIASCEDRCLLVTKHQDGEVNLLIYDAMGTEIKSKNLQIQIPKFAQITKNCVILVGRDGYQITIWTYFHNINAKDDLLLSKAFIETKSFHIDTLKQNQQQLINCDQTVKNSGIHISTICANENKLLVGRMNGIIHEINISDLFHVCNYEFFSIPAHCLSLNNQQTKCAVIDITGTCKIFQLSPTKELLTQFERKDSWMIVWARDHPDRFAVMEKTKMYVYKGLDPEEPLESSGYIADFDKLQLKLILLDELLASSGTIKREYIQNMDTKTLRDTRNLIKVSLQDALKFVQQNPHQTLWKLIGNESIRRHEFTIAKECFVQSRDYPSIQLIKRLETIKNSDLAEAEIYKWFGEFPKAQELYLKCGRRDLVVEMWKTVGEYGKALDLCNAGEKDILEREMCEWFSERGEYQNARKYKTVSRSYLISCAMLDDYDEIIESSARITDCKQLEFIANILRHVGLSKEASATYLKCNLREQAIECCLYLKDLLTAQELSNNTSLDYLKEFKEYLLSQNQVTQLVQLCWTVKQYDECSRLLVRLSRDLWSAGKPELSLKCLVFSNLSLMKSPLGVAGDLWKEVVNIHWYLLAQKLYFDNDCVGALKCVLKCKPSQWISNKQLASFVVYLSIQTQSRQSMFIGLQMFQCRSRTPSDLLLNTNIQIDYLKYVSKDNEIPMEDLCAKTGGKLINPKSCPICKSRFNNHSETICPVCHQKL